MRHVEARRKSHATVLGTALPENPAWGLLAGAGDNTRGEAARQTICQNRKQQQPDDHRIISTVRYRMYGTERFRTELVSAGSQLHVGFSRSFARSPNEEEAQRSQMLLY